jgi:superfamily II DNA or RNA helicase
MDSATESVKLRDYQQDAVKSVLLSLSQGNSPLLVAPTGSGKTVMAGAIMKDWQTNTGKPVFFFAHREELLEQAERMMGQFGLRGKVISIFAKQFDTSAEDMSMGLCVFDEAHHAVATSWLSIQARFTGPKVAITATPDRMDRQKLDEAGFSLCHEIYIRDLIKRGYLVRPMAQKLAVTLADFTLLTDDAVLEQVARNVLDELGRYSRKRTIVFLPDVDTSRRFSMALNKTGLRSVHLDGQSGKERERFVSDFKRGDLDCLCNVNLFTEGFDCPEIDCVVLLRSTQSRPLWCQMIGRGLRSAAGKTDCLILDPFWVCGEHALTAADAFTAHQDAKCKAKSGYSDPMADADKEDEQAENRLLANLKRLEGRKNAKEARERGLIDLSVVTPLLGLTPPPAASGDEPMTDLQSAQLEQHKIYAPKGTTYGQAKWMLHKMSERIGLATLRQVRKLRQFGHRNAQIYTFSQASNAIGNDWRISGTKFRKVFNK